MAGNCVAPSWLKDFRSVSTSAARYQQLSLNPQKLAGQCGKLKCCLNFELDQYVEAVKDFPSPNAKIKLKEGKAFVFKMDIFKRLVYLMAPDGATNGPVAVTLEDMHELLEMNKRGEYPHSLTEFALEEGPDEVDETYSNVVGQDSLTRFDEQRRRRKKRSGREPTQATKTSPVGAEAKASGNGSQQGGKPDGNKQGKPRKKRRRPPRNANAKT